MFLKACSNMGLAGGRGCGVPVTFFEGGGGGGVLFGWGDREHGVGAELIGLNPKRKPEGLILTL